MTVRRFSGALCVYLSGGRRFLSGSSVVVIGSGGVKMLNKVLIKLGAKLSLLKHQE